MYTLKVPSELSLPCQFSCSYLQQLVVRYAICCGSAWYAPYTGDSFVLTEAYSCTLRSSHYRGNDMPTLQCVV